MHGDFEWRIEKGLREEVDHGTKLLTQDLLKMSQDLCTYKGFVKIRNGLDRVN
jgi:hypothetical protein